MPAACPRGKIRRVGYTRKDGTKVKSTCVRDTGLPGKTPASRKVLPKPVAGNLKKFGYGDVKNTSAAVRHAALLKGVKAAGYATIIRRVNLVANYNKRTSPRVHRIMRSDKKWMQKNLADKYSKSALRKRARMPRGARIALTIDDVSKRKLVKAGKRVVGGRSRQLYRLSDSTSKFYRYHKSTGGMGRRYV